LKSKNRVKGVKVSKKLRQKVKDYIKEEEEKHVKKFS
jgi:hypothetical protein